jgi:ribosome recycling factor
MAKGILNEAQDKMQKSLDALGQELMHIRTGRASAALLDMVDVEVYGTKMKVNQLANVAVPEPRMLTITPWDKSQLGTIERAIMASPLEITPQNDGTIIRLPIPPLTEERRKDLVKFAHKLAEEARVSVRNIRRHAVDTIKKSQKDGAIPEDDAHRQTAEVQKLTDEYVGRIDSALKHKEEEIMEV